MFAVIRYCDDKQKLVVVPTKKIKNLSATSPEGSFNPKKRYRVRWFDANDGKWTKEYFKAQILLLGDSREELEGRIQNPSSRIRISAWDSDEDSDLESEEAETPVSASALNKRKMMHTKEAEKEARERVLQERRKKMLRELQPIVKVDSPCNSCRQAEKREAELRRELEDSRRQLAALRELNTQLQEELLRSLRLSRERGGHEVDDREVEEHQNQEEAQKTEIMEERTNRNGEIEIHIGEDIWVNQEPFQVSRGKEDSVFVREVAVMIWGSSTLAQRSLSGRVCPSKPGSIPKKPLTPAKLRILRECFRRKVEEETSSKSEQSLRMERFKRHLQSKLNDVGRLNSKKKL